MIEKGRIVKEGMGGFLCPPTHPMHDYSVETDLRRPRNDRGSMSLDYATESPILDDATRKAAHDLLASWQKPDLDAPEIREWILQVLGYFAGCYNMEPEKETGWHTDRLLIDADLNPMAYADEHAGVHCIRKYYPDYQPMAEDFAGAYWGRKPEIV